MGAAPEWYLALIAFYNIMAIVSLKTNNDLWVIIYVAIAIVILRDDIGSIEIFTIFAIPFIASYIENRMGKNKTEK